jgi:hypothetical protein
LRYAITLEPPVEPANEFEKDPKAAESFFQLLEQAKPEAAYASSTRRYLIIIVNADSQEDLLKLLAPIWHTFKAYPRVEPVLTLDEFKAAFQEVGKQVKDL